MVARAARSLTLRFSFSRSHADPPLPAVQRRLLRQPDPVADHPDPGHSCCRAGFSSSCVKVWGRTSLWLLRVIAGTKVEITGLEKIPPGGALVAAKHQSFLETFALVTLFDDPTFILKRELMWIPFFGWYLAKARCVPVEPQGGIARAGADDGAGEGRGPARAPDHHLSRRHAPAAGRAAGLQVRRGASLPESRLPLHSGRAEFGPVLAAPPVHPPSRHDPRSRCSSPSRRAFRAKSSSS